MKPRRLAACYRSPYLGLAVLQDDAVIEVKRHRLCCSKAKVALRQRVASLVNAYSISEVTVEPNTLPHRALKGWKGTRLLRVSLKQVKERLLSADEPKTTANLFAKLIAEQPHLRRLAQHLSSGRTVSTSDAWATVALLAIALGLTET